VHPAALPRRRRWMLLGVEPRREAFSDPRVRKSCLGHGSRGAACVDRATRTPTTGCRSLGASPGRSRCPGRSTRSRRVPRTVFHVKRCNGAPIPGGGGLRTASRDVSRATALPKGSGPTSGMAPQVTPGSFGRACGRGQERPHPPDSAKRGSQPVPISRPRGRTRAPAVVRSSNGMGTKRPPSAPVQPLQSTRHGPPRGDSGRLRPRHARSRRNARSESG
jgi:hypothetical protein